MPRIKKISGDRDNQVYQKREKRIEKPGNCCNDRSHGNEHRLLELCLKKFPVSIHITQMTGLGDVVYMI